MNLGHYIIDEKGEIKEVDLMTWAKWLETPKGQKDRRIGFDELPEVHVSTVFLGLDHSFGHGAPLLFETMVFENRETEMDFGFGGREDKRMVNKPVEDYTNRYHTLEEARKGHADTVKRATAEAIFWHCEICEEARPNSKISVYTYPLKELPGGERNVKYCNDKEDCLKGAIDKSLTGKI